VIFILIAKIGKHQVRVIDNSEDKVYRITSSFWMIPRLFIMKQSFMCVVKQKALQHLPKKKDRL